MKRPGRIAAAGIDPHQASCIIAVLSETGKVLATPVVKTNGEALVTTLCSCVWLTHLEVRSGRMQKHVGPRWKNMSQPKKLLRTECTRCLTNRRFLLPM